MPQALAINLHFFSLKSHLTLPSNGKLSQRLQTFLITIVTNV